MQFRSLQHIIEAIQALVEPDRIVVLGSSSLLGTAPELGEPGAPVALSLDADVLVTPADDQTASILHEAVGEGSLFQQRYGCYADLLRPDIIETLPAGWDQRLRSLPGSSKVFFLDPYDTALAKLALGRPKDIDVLVALVQRNIINPIELTSRFQALDWSEKRIFQTGRNLDTLKKRLAE